MFCSCWRSSASAPRPALWDIVKRYPKKRGYQFKPPKLKPVVLNIEKLEKFFNDKDVINLNSLREKNLIKNSDIKVKILGNGEIKKALIFKGILTFSKSAITKIEKAGGKIETQEAERPTLTKKERKAIKQAKKPTASNAVKKPASNAVKKPASNAVKAAPDVIKKDKKIEKAERQEAKKVGPKQISPKPEAKPKKAAKPEAKKEAKEKKIDTKKIKK